MNVKTLMQIVCLTGAVALPAGTLSAAVTDTAACACARRAEERNFPQEASRLLQAVRSAAARLNVHASNLESVMRSGSSWQTHASELAGAREEINFIGRQLQLLQEIRTQATPGQREVIDSILPSAVAAAAHTEAAIRHINENQRSLWLESYTSRLRWLMESTNRIRNSVDLHFDIEDAQNRLDLLRQQASSL